MRGLRPELQAVIGHEMGQVKHLDIKLLTLVAGLIWAVVVVSDGLGRGLRYGFWGRSSSQNSKNLGPPESIDSPAATTVAITRVASDLCIADPLGRQVTNMKGLVGGLFATHQPMAIRLARLKTMGYQAQKAA